jgi:hypothetical protein
MTNYTTRVELHQAVEEDYRQLTLAMKNESFIADKSNKTSGSLTFRRQAGLDIKEVINAVQKAASSTGKKFSFTVMKDKSLDKQENRKRLTLQ